MHNPNSPILFGEYDEDQVKERKDVESYKTNNEDDITKQISLF